MQWSWIDPDAEVGPVMRVGPDIYERERPGQRVLRLTTTHSPGLDYLQPAVAGFRAVAERWGAPVVFVLEPDVRKPPAARFLFEWSRAAWENGSVDQSWFLMGWPLTRVVGNIVCRAFCAGGMPFEAVGGRRELDQRLDEMDLSCPRAGFALVGAEQNALVVRRRFGEGAYGQLLTRAFRRTRGGDNPPP